MTAEQIEIVILITGVSLGFYVQMIAGFGSALVAMPVLLSVMEIQEATAIMSLFFFVFSIVQIYYNRQLADRPTVYKMVLGVAVGIAAGILLLKFGKPEILKRLLGVFILLYVINRLIKQGTYSWIDKLGLLFGFGSGIFSGLFSTGGPLCVIYVNNKMFDAKVFRATVIVILGLADIFKLPVLIATDILTKDSAMKSLYAAPFFVLALLLGKITYRKINEVIFKRLLLVMLTVSGLFLMIR